MSRQEEGSGDASAALRPGPLPAAPVEPQSVSPLRAAVPIAEGWCLDLNIAPKDGTPVQLLVRFDEHTTEQEDLARTIGAVTHDGPDAVEQFGFQFAGWCWSHDHWTEGKGEIVAWAPMVALPGQPQMVIPTSDRDAAWDHARSVMFEAHLRHEAQAIEARSAKTEGLGPEGESAVAAGHAPDLPLTPPQPEKESV